MKDINYISGMIALVEYSSKQIQLATGAWGTLYSLYTLYILFFYTISYIKVNEYSINTFSTEIQLLK